MQCFSDSLMFSPFFRFAMSDTMIYRKQDEMNWTEEFMYENVYALETSFSSEMWKRVFQTTKGRSSKWKLFSNIWFEIKLNGTNSRTFSQWKKFLIRKREEKKRQNIEANTHLNWSFVCFAAIHFIEIYWITVHCQIENFILCICNEYKRKMELFLL